MQGTALWFSFLNDAISTQQTWESELRGCPNTLLTPHVGAYLPSFSCPVVETHLIGGSTEEAQEAIGGDVANKLISFINAGSTLGAVNFPQMALPYSPNTHRILNIHKNQPGVLRVRIHRLFIP